jgi:hypothetical protein
MPFSVALVVVSEGQMSGKTNELFWERCEKKRLGVTKGRTRIFLESLMKITHRLYVQAGIRKRLLPKTKQEC